MKRFKKIKVYGADAKNRKAYDYSYEKKLPEGFMEKKTETGGVSAVRITA